jgi:DNA-damage-inducible protein J
MEDEPMSNDAVVRARIDSDVKARATEALEAMGLSVSDVIRLLLLQIAEEKRLPFTVKVPNAATVEAMAELEAGKGKRFGNADELFRDLGI